MEGRPHDEIPYDYSEGQYAVRCALAGLCTARPHFAEAPAGAEERGARGGEVRPEERRCGVGVHGRGGRPDQRRRV